MKSITQSYIALLRLMCLSLVVLSLGSTLMAAPSAHPAGSPLVSKGGPSLAQAQAYSAFRESLPHTYGDYFIQPGLRADQAAVGHEIAYPMGANEVSVTSTVQTTDITLPTYPPTIPLDPTTGLPENSAPTPTNVDPAWSHNASFIVFASNRTINPTTGALTIVPNFHLFAIAASGDPSTLVQLTSGTGNERWPTLLGPNDNEIAFCESANPGGSYALEEANLGTGATGGLQITNVTPLVSSGLPADVEHPSYGAGVIAFAGGSSPAAIHHIFTINISTGAVIQLTNGPADERNPSCSQTSGSTLIAFQSNATAYNSGVSTAPQVSSGANSAGGSGDPIYGSAPNNIFVMYYLGSAIPQQVSSDGSNDNICPSWSISTTANCELAWASTNRIDTITQAVDPMHSIVYLDTTIDPSGKDLDTVEVSSDAIVLNVSDSGTPSYFDNIQPAITDPAKNDSIAYTTNRYLVNGPDDNPGYGTAQEVEPIQAPTNPSTDTTGPTLELFTSHTTDVTPPTLLNYSSAEIVHISNANDPNNAPIRNAISPGTTLKFTVRVSDRQSGIGAVYLQIKDPNSKYQDPFGLEHRVYSRNEGFFPYDEAGTLWIGPAIGGFNGSDPIELGTEVSQNPGFSTTLTAAAAAKATSITVASEAGMAAGDQISINGQTVYIIGFGTSAGSVDITSLGAAEPSGATVNDVGYLDFLGQEVDDEAVNLADTSNGGSFDPTNPANFVVPTYTPSYEDSVPNSGGEITIPTYWLPLTADTTQDGNGGVTYSGTWQTPANYPSDFIIDVVAFDNATVPSTGGAPPPPAPHTHRPAIAGAALAPNWIIYDNVWGLSTAPSPTPSGSSVLVVSDYGSPQKFFSRFNVPGNVPINFYGAESYVTDLDVNANDLSNGDAEVVAPQDGLSVPPPGQTGTDVFSPIYSDWNFNPGRWPALNPGYANGLGVNSYVDSQQGNVSTVDGAPYPASQSYAIWRILCRGPIPESTLLEYAPLQASQPNPSNPSEQQTVLVANSCVLWISPFAGDEFVDAGTITDPSTQASLEAFLNAGGRLEIEGLDIGYSLTDNGTTPNSFYSNYLEASFLTDAVGYLPATIILSKKNNATGTETPFFPDLFEHDAYYDNNNVIEQLNGIGHSGFAFPLSSSPGIEYMPPSASTLSIGNLAFPGDPTAERTDASMNASNDELGFIDGFSVSSPVLTEIYGVYNNNPGDQFMLYDTASNGSIVVYGSFGLEAISQEVEPFTPTGATQPVFVSVNDRTNLIHNTICLMRTGQISGQVVSTGTGGAGVGGALVEATLGGKAYTAFTDDSGHFTIVGCPPGEYAISVTAGSAHANGNALFVHGGDVAGPISVVINPPAPGSLKVTVVNSSGNGIAGVTVTATQTPGGNTLPSQVTNSNGVATFSNAPAATYDVVADGSAVGYSVSSPVPATVTAGNQTSITITLQAAPATLYGLVSGIPNGSTATVTVVDSNGKLVASGTTGATFTATGTGFDGGQANYEFTVPASPSGVTYTVQASLYGYSSTAVSGLTLANNQKQRENFTLAAAPNANVYGIVENSATGSAVAGATVTFTDASGTPHSTTTLSTPVNAQAPGDDSPANYGVDASGNLNFSLPEGTYQVTVSAPGLVSPPTQLVTITTNPQRVDFTGANGVQPLHTFQAGLTLFSVPYDYSSVGSLTNVFQGWADPTLAVWDPAISEYDVTGVTPPGGRTNLANQVVLGQGYWAHFPSSVGLEAGGTPAPTTSPFSITLHQGWNMIGDPFIGSVNMADFQVVNIHGQSYSWQQATSDAISLVNPILYSYSSATGQYAEHYVGSTLGLGSDLNPAMAPYVGYWIEAFTPVALVIAPPPSAPSDLTATAGTGNVALAWTGTPGATGYNIYRGTTSGGETLLTSGVSGTSYTDSSVSTGTTYFYEVTATNAAGESGMSNEASASP